MCARPTRYYKRALCTRRYALLNSGISHIPCLRVLLARLPMHSLKTGCTRISFPPWHKWWRNHDFPLEHEKVCCFLAYHLYVFFPGYISVYARFYSAIFKKFFRLRSCCNLDGRTGFWMKMVIFTITQRKHPPLSAVDRYEGMLGCSCHFISSVSGWEWSRVSAFAHRKVFANPMCTLF